MGTGAHVKKLRTTRGRAQALDSSARSPAGSGEVSATVVDFIALEPKLIIETDGGHHALQLDEDAKRSDWLASNGFRVLRFWNDEVLQQTDKVLETIRHSLLAGGAT